MPKLNDILREIDQLSEDEKRILMDYVKQMGRKRHKMPPCTHGGSSLGDIAGRFTSLMTSTLSCRMHSGKTSHLVDG